MANYISKHIHILFLIGLMGSIGMFNACGPTESAQNQTNENDTSSDHTTSPELSLEPSQSSEESTRTRNLTATDSVGFSFEKKFPQLYQLLKDYPEVLEKVSQYAKKAIYREEVSDEEDLLALMEKRGNEIIPLISPYFENMDPAVFQQKFDVLNAELFKLGIQMTTAEGMFTGLGPSKMITPNLRVQQMNTSQGFDAIQNYDAFTDAMTHSMSGEYPFLDMEPYFNMLASGEQLRNAENARVYYAKVEENFRRALEVLTDIHVVTNEGARIGGIHTEAYPYTCNLEQMQSLLNKYQKSAYYSVIQNILEYPSEITSRPETIYLIVTEWAENEQIAREKIFKYLTNQQDIPHYLAIQSGDGSTEYAVIYRFFENEKQANQAMELSKDKNIDGEMIMVSVQGDKLYQTGI